MKRAAAIHEGDAVNAPVGLASNGSAPEASASSPSPSHSNLQPLPAPDREAIADQFAAVAQQLGQAAAGMRELSETLAEILRNQLGSLVAAEQQVGAAASFQTRRANMNATSALSTESITKSSALPALSGATPGAPSSPRRELLTATDIATLLAIDARSFRRLRTDRSQKFPAAITIGSSKRWRAKEVHEWLANRRPG